MIRRGRTRAPAAAAGARAAGASLVLALAAMSAAPAPTPGPHAWMRDPYIQRYTGHPAPPFVLKDLHGQTVRLPGYRGKVVLLNFWYSTCLPCRKETSDLIALHGAHKGHGFTVLGINLDAVMLPQARGRALQDFLKEFAIPYPVLIADQKTMDAYGGIPVQPISFLLDRQGIVVRVFWGAYPAGVYERVLRPLLAVPGALPAVPGAPLLQPGP